MLLRHSTSEVFTVFLFHFSGCKSMRRADFVFSKWSRYFVEKYSTAIFVS